MIIKSTELKNNLGKYLMDCAKEEIIITRNNRKIAVLRSYKEEPDSFDNKYDDWEVSDRQAEAFNLEAKTMTFEEFLEFNENTERIYEYIDGEVYLHTAPGTMHQRAIGELYVILYNWFKGKKCIPILSPYEIILQRSDDNNNLVQPDLVVICDLEEKLNEKDRYKGVPALVIEIASPSTRSRDAVKKLDLYMSTGVIEYWIVNPVNEEVTVNFFENGEISKSRTFRKGETLNSYYFEGLAVKLKKIFT
jgi:prevent-host-death family protein